MKAEDIFEDLEILILQNEDDFDRGSGKFILRKFIKEKLYKQLTLTDVSTRELPPWVRPLITIITMSLVTVYVIYKTFYVC